METLYSLRSAYRPPLLSVSVVDASRLREAALVLRGGLGTLLRGEAAMVLDALLDGLKGDSCPFLEAVDEVVSRHLDNPDFGAEALAASVPGVGRTAFYARLKALTGMTPKAYLREARLQEASRLLSRTQMGVSEVSYAVGIDDPQYFSRLFRSRFGLSPREYRRGLRR